MNQLKIETAGGRTTFAPGETLEAAAQWQLENPANAVEFRLVWYSRASDQEHTTFVRDMSIVDRVRFESPERTGAERWTVRLPNGPYSFTGNLISLVWALELVVEPAPDTHRLEITVAPNGKAIALHAENKADESA
jgi:hypothetical protein